LRVDLAVPGGSSFEQAPKTYKNKGPIRKKKIKDQSKRKRPVKKIKTRQK
jgi:hypothetical protein